MIKRLLNVAQIRVYVLFAVYILLSCTVLAQEERILPRSQGSSFEGYHYYIGFMRNELDINRNTNDPVFLDIYIATSIPTDVTVRLPWETSGTVYKLGGDSILSIYFSRRDAIDLEMIKSEVPLKQLIEITSNHEITVSAMTSNFYTSDAYTALPVPNWGKEYVIMSMPNDTYTPTKDKKDTTIRPGQFLVMSSEDSTLVQFKPRVKTIKHDSDEFVSIYLMKGQCYLVQSSDSLGLGYGDLTGTIVRSNKPVGVLSGHVRATVPVGILDPRDWGRDSKDCLVEMLLPTKIWGTKYATTPIKIYSAGDLIRVACIQPYTTFTAQAKNVSRTVTLVNPGDWVEFYPVDQSITWTSDKPISIAQYIPTSFYDEVQDFDPALVVIPPIEQYISRALFQIQPNPDWSWITKFYYQYLNVICEPEAINTLKIDGTLVSVNNPNILTQVVAGSNLHFVTISLQPGVHRITSESGKFSGIVYGVGPDDSYAYPLGLSLYKTDIIDSTPPVFKFSDDCGRLKIISNELITDTTVGFESIKVITDSTYNFKWVIQDATDSSVSTEINAQPIDYNRDGVILIETRDRLGNGRQLKYIFNALSIDVRNNIVFQSVSWLDSICEKVIIKNYGTDTIFFYGGKITGDKRVNFYDSEPPQKPLAPKDSIVFYVCFKPLGDSTDLKAMLTLNLPCDRLYSIPISGKVAALSIDTLGWDFGKVLLGDHFYL
ncbi:MAG: IgGFc-binding protein [Ignavibacteriae bacterium]|nr:IgGFc-binding protein [Ignavibacteriota bacterium]